MPFFYIKNEYEELKNIIEPVVNEMNVFMGNRNLRGKKRNTLRVFIDSYDNMI